MDRSSCRRFAILVLGLCLVFGASTAALGAAKDRKTLILRGRVTGADGWPLVGARVRARSITPDAQRGRAATDDAGQFMLELPLGSPADLVRHPVSLRVSAELKGWRLAAAGGEPEVGLDLRVAAGDDGITRCEVRSNHAGVGATVVRMLTADGEMAQVATIAFLGTRGEESVTPPVREMPLVDRVPLAGVQVAARRPVEAKGPAVTPPAPPPAVKSAPVSAPPQKEAAITPPQARAESPKDTTRAKPASPPAVAAPSPAPAKAVAPATEPPASPPPGAAMPPPPMQAPAARPLGRDASRVADSLARAQGGRKDRDPVRSAAETELLERAVQRDAARRAAEQEMALRAAASRRKPGDTRAIAAERERLRRAAAIRREAEDAARRTTQVRTARVTAEQDSIRRAAEAEKAERVTAKEAARRAAAAETEWRHAERDSVRRAEADAEVGRKADRDGGRRATAAAEATRRAAVQDSIRRAGEEANRRAAQETVRRAADAEAARRAAAEERTRRAAEQEAVRRATMREAERRAAELRQRRAGTPAPAPRDTVNRVTPPSAARATSDTAASAVRPKPDGEPRLRSGPLVIRATDPAGAPAAGEPCTCRIEGTVEVDWDKPLPKRARVVVSLVPNPTIHDTVELFMGSPRAFRLPPAPCGPQRLRLVNQGSMRFDVVSTEAMKGFQCEAGARYQFRIVLKPRR